MERKGIKIPSLFEVSKAGVEDIHPFFERPISKDPRFSKQRKLFEEGRKLTPGAVQSNARWTVPQPIYWSKARGSHIWDVNGNEFVDYYCNIAALVLGHADPDVTQAVEKQLDLGLGPAIETELTIDCMKLINRMVPSAEMIRFSNSGTEANMHALHIARGYTKKDKILRFAGNFHGGNDYFLVDTTPNQPDFNTFTVTAKPGLCKDGADKTLVVDYNDLEAAEKVVKKHKDEIAAIWLEPIFFNLGCILPKEGFLKGLRELAGDYGLLLVFDEVISGFRSAPGGAQEYYGVTPDLTILGKGLSNGFGLAAVVGKADVMKVIHPKKGIGIGVPFGGTFNGHQIALAACKATLEKMKDGAVSKRLWESAKKLAEGLNDMAQRLNFDMVVPYHAGKFAIYFTPEAPVDSRTCTKAFEQKREEKYLEFYDHMLKEGILLYPSQIGDQGLTYAHTEDDIEKALVAAEKALRTIGP
jgi:glutamate-1-semialdehyde 2,1-aminomutase